jgi:hypothetical protein
MSDILVDQTSITNPTRPFSLLNGSEIDAEVAVRLSRAIWTALVSHDQGLALKMKAALSAEISALQMQHEVDGSEEGDTNEAIACLLQHFLRDEDG